MLIKILFITDAYSKDVYSGRRRYELWSVWDADGLLVAMVLATVWLVYRL